jgi:general secretion pathway protein L
MRKALHLQIDPEAPGCGHWVLTDTQGRPEGSPCHGTLAEVHTQAAGRQLIVLVPATDVLLADAQVPSHSRRRTAQAIPYALEERLAEDVEALHFAPGQREDDGSIATAVVARARMDAWIQALQEAQLQPDRMVSALFAVAPEPQGWHILVQQNRALVRTGPQAGFAVEADVLPACLALALQDATPPARVRLSLDSAEVDPDVLRHALGASGAEVETAAGDAPFIASADAIDLLQGPYSRREQLGRRLRPWRAAAALAGVWLALQGGALMMEYRALAAESRALTQEIDRVFRETFPEVQRVVDPRIQMEQGLAELRAQHGGGGNGGFLRLLESAGEVLAETRGLELHGVSYRAPHLDLDLTVPNLQDLDALKQRLARTGGLDVDIQSATASDQNVRGRLRLREAA